jgi:hypothetical protein
MEDNLTSNSGNTPLRESGYSGNSSGISENIKYKSVHIQKLPPVERKTNRQQETNVEEYWKGKLCSCNLYKCKCDMKVLCSLKNSDANTYFKHNPFFGAFCKAYDNHGDVAVSPDDVWMVICIYFAKYVNDNAEKMRDMFVSHSGKKELTVVTENEVKESQWDEFFDLMLEAISKNTKDDVVNLLQANFSSTTHIEKILSTATVMDTFKQYFSYERCIPCCGIQNIHFAGTLGDWENVLYKLKQLEKYAVSSQLTNYIKNLSPVVQKFIDTYNGKVDVNFWNKIVNITYGSLGSGSTSYISGWILFFFGLVGQEESIPLNSVSVPIKIDNKLTGVVKTVQLVGGFSGVYEKDNIYRPQMSLAIIHKKDS